jgi:hypothetical protein
MDNHLPIVDNPIQDEDIAKPDDELGVLPLSLLGQQDLGVNYAPVNPQYQDPFGDTVR